MAEVPNPRAWMYDRCYSGKKGLKEAFVEGVEHFLETARQCKYYIPDGGIRCPCIKCECTRILKDEVVRVHLHQKGFMPDYKLWNFHGEEIPSTYEPSFIEPCGRGFVPSRVASQAINWSIKDQFLQPWPSWGAIPIEDKELFWQRFKQDVQWIAEHEAQIKKNFHRKASQRLSTIFRYARITGRPPYWMGEHIWNSLLEHWNSPNYRNKCVTVQRNRMLEKGGVLHIGGSITAHEHALRMEDFSLRLSQARSEIRSISDAESKVDADNDIIRQPSASSTDKSNFVSREVYDAVLARVENLENLVRTWLSQQGQNQSAPSSSQQQCPPMQPIPMQPSTNQQSQCPPMQPTPMQPSTNQQSPPHQLPVQEEEDDDDSDDYNDY
ncbi:uncharacterized protein LOC106774393 [Vigna radiata var. radiata]|uniref:Uncharacterized protein LOC106774393 n=1 Tax=Vigna radiata var. radiata TaxID=3916 RepID=A0A1S3VER9_VIGRR|nr:uncharacterized protein LOC106774393 [Vigna radiata var. radiata]